MSKSRVMNRALKMLGGRAKRNPFARSEVARAEGLFREFTGHEPTRQAKFPRKEMRVALAVGELEGVMYVATRDGKRERYFHRFKQSSRPLLVASHDGSNIGIVGGRYHFTDRGIVDK